jgi:creatinine amidohydrolase
MQLTDLSSPALARLAPDVPIVLPVAAIEQHGGHLPVCTDSLLLGEIVARVAPRLGDRVVFAPLLWLGNSHHHADFPGTMSAAPRTYLDLLADLVDGFVAHGFRRLAFINGHGGNDVPCKQAIFEARQRHRTTPDLLLLSATYWSLGARPGEHDATLVQREMGHACEWETSMMLRAAPQLVGPWADLEPVPLGTGFAPGARGWVMADRSRPGHIGSPHAATATKGEALFGLFAADVAAWLERVAAWDGHSWDG